MKREDIIWWRQMRSGGRTLFILLECILYHGTRSTFWLAVVFAVLSLLGNESHSVMDFLANFVFGWAVLSVIVGLVASSTLWRQYERDYRKYGGCDEEA